MRRPTRRNINLLRLLVLLCILALGIARLWKGAVVPGPQQSQARFSAVLDHTVDGDTAWFRDERGQVIKVRFIGIDAPETGSAEYFSSGLLAARLLEGAQGIELEPDPGKPQDKHGRMLAWIWLTMADGSELLLQEEMLKAGKAELYRDASGSKYYERLRSIRQP